MKNNSPEVSFGGIQIIRVPSEPPHTLIEYKLPMSVKTFADKEDLAQYEAILTSTVQLKISIVFRMVEFLGTLGYQGDHDGDELGEFQSVLGEIGGRLARSLEEIEMAFDRQKEVSIAIDDQLSETVLPVQIGFDVASASGDDLAVIISGLMNNPNLPTRIFNTLADDLFEVKDPYSVENIRFNFEKFSKEEAENES